MSKLDLHFWARCIDGQLVAFGSGTDATKTLPVLDAGIDLNQPVEDVIAQLEAMQQEQRGGTMDESIKAYLRQAWAQMEASGSGLAGIRAEIKLDLMFESPDDPEPPVEEPLPEPPPGEAVRPGRDRAAVFA